MSFNAPLGDAYVRVSFDTSGLAAQTQQIKRSLSSTLSGLATQFNKFGMLFTRYFTLPILAAFTAILKDVPEIKWAFSGIGDAITRLTETLRAAGIIDFFAGMIDKVRQFVDWLSTLDPATLRVGTAFLLLLATLGPALKLLSFSIKTIQGLSIAFGVLRVAIALAFSHPILLAITAIVSGLILLGYWFENNAEVIDKWAKSIANSINNVLPDWFKNFMSGGGSTYKGAFEGMQKSHKDSTDKVNEQNEKTDKSFKSLYMNVVGHSYVPDMAKETVSWYEWMAKGMKDAAGGAIDWVDRKMSGSSFVKGTQAQGKDAANKGAGREAFGQVFGGVKFDIGKSGFGIMDGIQQGLMGFVNNFFTKMLQNLLKNTIGKLFENTLGGLFGGLFSGLGFAGGGRPPMGKASLVGERGPELFVPDSAGTVIPNSELGGGNSITQIFNVSTGVAGTVRQEMRSMLPALQAATLKAVQDSARRGGQYSRGVRGG